MAGYYIPPAGTSAAAFWIRGIDSIDPAKPAAILADNIDPKTGEMAAVATGLHPVDAALIEAFRVRRASGASTQDFGNRFHRVRKKTERTERELRDEAELTLRPFVQRGDITVQRIVIDLNRGWDMGALVIDYTNNLTRQRRSIG